MASLNNSAAISRSLAAISGHPAISQISQPEFDAATQNTIVDVTFTVNLPSEWKKKGESPSGVRYKEIVRLNFPKQYPVFPPRLTLRKDFSKNFPHILRILDDGTPVPCIYDGEVTELLHQRGFIGIIDQIMNWLERAAFNELLDASQGWEPVRRDHLENILVADSEILRNLVNGNGGHKFFEYFYRKLEPHYNIATIGQVTNSQIEVNQKSVAEILKISRSEFDSLFGNSKSLALVVWSDRCPKGKLVDLESYYPETVTNLKELKSRASLYGCSKQLNSGLEVLRKSVSGKYSEVSHSLAIILLVRRPINLIGSTSNIELCPYIMNIRTPELFPKGDATEVRPAAHLEAMSCTLLSQMTGGETKYRRPSWKLYGAGSLGSKIALHLARAGRGPSAVYDKSLFYPHNIARHALVPAYQSKFPEFGRKADLLCRALGELDQIATPYFIDVRLLLTTIVEEQEQMSWNGIWAVVNSTASLSVREAIAASHSRRARVIETSLLAAGHIGMITTEGSDRNPNSIDLAAEFYALIQHNLKLADIVFKKDDATSRQPIGEGCGSLTMRMSDGRLSLFAAGISEYLLKKQRSGLPDKEGEILIGALSDCEFGIQWNKFKLPPLKIISAINNDIWHVRIHQRALEKIEAEIKRNPAVETGGVLMGRISEVSNTVNVVDVLEAPKDSVRSKNEFTLGIKGLSQSIQSYSESVNGTLYCLGTWHSHLVSSCPSDTDWNTLKKLSSTSLIPSILLIHTPTKYVALLSDSTNT